MLTHDAHKTFRYLSVEPEVLQWLALEREILGFDQVFSVAAEILVCVNGQRFPFITANNLHHVPTLIGHDAGNLFVSEVKEDVVSMSYMGRVMIDPVQPFVKRGCNGYADFVRKSGADSGNTCNQYPKPPAL